MSLKASLKSVIAEMDSFGGVEKGSDRRHWFLPFAPSARESRASATMEGRRFEQKKKKSL